MTSIMWMMCRKVQVGWPCVLHMFRVPGTVYKVPCECTFAILETVPPMALPLLPILRTDLFVAAFTLSLSCFGTVYFYQERLQTVPSKQCCLQLLCGTLQLFYILWWLHCSFHKTYSWGIWTTAVHWGSHSDFREALWSSLGKTTGLLVSNSELTSLPEHLKTPSSSTSPSSLTN